MLETQLARLTASELVRRTREQEDAYWFKHALVQDTARASLLHNERKRLHRLVGESLETLYPERRAELAPLLAQHFGEAGDDAKTLEYAELSGDVSSRINANAEALNCYTRALELAERTATPSVRLQDLYLKRGRVLELQGNFDAALENYQALETLGSARGDAPLELAALMAQATVLSIPSVRHDPPRAQALSDRALALARAVNDKAAQAKILWNLMLLHSRVGMRYQRAFQYGEQALRIARENNLPERLAYVLNDLVPMYYYRGEPERGKQANLEARAMWRALENMPMLSSNYGYASMMHLFAGEFAEAIAASQEGVRLSREIGNEWNEAFAQTWVGEAYIEKGEIETAERVMVAAIELGARAFPPTLVATRSDLARLYTDLGDAPRGIALSELALRIAEERFPPMRPVATSALIHAYLAAGLLERAREIEPDSAELLDLDANPMYATDGIRGQIELAYAEHAFVRVLDLCDLFREFCERSSLKQYAPELLRVQAQTLAQLGEWDAAAEALAQARAMAEQMAARWSLWQILAVSSRLEQARGYLEKAEAYRTQGRAWIAEIAARTPKEYRARFVERAHRSF